MKTAMHQMLDELMVHEYTIPLELIVKCKELIDVEKEQINKACYDGYYKEDEKYTYEYYNENYTNGL